MGAFPQLFWYQENYSSAGVRHRAEKIGWHMLLGRAEIRILVYGTWTRGFDPPWKIYLTTSTSNKNLKNKSTKAVRTFLLMSFAFHKRITRCGKWLPAWRQAGMKWARTVNTRLENAKNFIQSSLSWHSILIFRTCGVDHWFILRFHDERKPHSCINERSTLYNGSRVSGKAVSIPSC